jgi:hypothetical protein
MKKNQYFYLIFLLTLSLFVACKDFLKIDPAADQVDIQKVYSSDEVAISAVRGLYVTLAYLGSFGTGSSFGISAAAGRSADEYSNYSNNTNLIQFSENNLDPLNTNLRAHYWQTAYKVVYASNTILENLERSNISDNVRLQLQGEAKFIRAFCNFYLTNLYGNIPLIMTSDYRINAIAFQSPMEEVYQQIIKDLIEAKQALTDNYPSSDRIRANKWAASALLARVYLYHRDWANAETESSAIIARNTQYSLKADLDQVFLKSSTEAILQFYLSGTTVNTYEGSYFILMAAPTDGVTVSSQLLAAFEAGDQRSSKWIGTFTSGTTSYRFPYKYKIKTGATPLNEYSMVMRLAEQYLIRAEARINQNNIDLGIADLNIIRTRARATPTALVPNPLPSLPNGLNKANALLAVEQERRIELFSEWGHRWLDLKRTGRADAVLAPLKGSNWQTTDILYPIPSIEIVNNPNLKQNPGYQ